VTRLGFRRVGDPVCDLADLGDHDFAGIDSVHLASPSGREHTLVGWLWRTIGGVLTSRTVLMPDDGGMLPPGPTTAFPSAPDDVGSHEATPQIAKLSSLDPALLELLRHEALTAAPPWVAEYGEYQSGGWWTASLLNESGVGDDVAIRDCDPVPTDLLRRMPATARFLDSLGLRCMWARLARLAPNSFLWEHRDYADLRQTSRVRLHVPLATNPSAALVAGGARVHLMVGHLWRLLPTRAHGACNLLGPDRLHLIIDVYPDGGEFDCGADLGPGELDWLPEPADGELREHLAEAHRLVRAGFVRAAERSLLRLFYRYRLPEGRVYDLLMELHAGLGRSADAARWKELRATLLDRSATGSMGT
jgi:Aspartyl/Asparaginyl beta-hydroxylase